MDIVADIGGTNTRVAGTLDGMTLYEPIVHETLLSYEAGVRDLIAMAQAIAGARTIDRIAIGVPGVVYGEKRSLCASGNLLDWIGRPFVDDLEQGLGGKVSLTNDCAQAGLGEAVFGAGRGVPVIAYATVSTGVNGAKITNGALEPAAFSSEAGLQYVFLNGQPRVLDSLVSGGTLQRMFRRHPRTIEADHPIWAEFATYTAYGVYNMIMHWAPHRVVLGGGMFGSPGISVDSVRETIHELMKNFQFPILPEIVPAALGDFGGLWGGLVVLKNLK